MTEGKATHADASSSTSRTSSASRSTGRTRRAPRPRTSRPACCRARAPGLDRRLPTLGTGDVRVARLPERTRAPARASAGPSGLLLNWNNQSAPGFMHGDDDAVRLGAPRRAVRPVPANGHAGRRRQRDEPRRDRGRALAGVAGREPGAARRRGAEPARRAASWTCSTTGCGATRPRLDADNNGQYDDAGPTIMDAVWRPIAEAVMRPVFGDLLGDARRRPRARRPRRRVLRRQGPAHAARPSAVQRQVQPALLRQRVARRVPGVAVGGGRCRVADRSSPQQGAGPGGVAQRRASRRASRPASSPTRSGPRTGRRSSRCSSSPTVRSGATIGSWSSAWTCNGSWASSDSVSSRRSRPTGRRTCRPRAPRRSGTRAPDVRRHRARPERSGT